MSAQHTPAPWNWDGNVCDYDATQEAPWLVHADKYPPILGGQIKCANEADARLITAVPDLLAACQVMVKQFGFEVVHVGLTHDEKQAITQAMEAIAKAVQS